MMRIYAVRTSDNEDIFVDFAECGDCHNEVEVYHQDKSHELGWGQLINHSMAPMRAICAGSGRAVRYGEQFQERLI